MREFLNNERFVRLDRMVEARPSALQSGMADRSVDLSPIKSQSGAFISSIFENGCYSRGGIWKLPSIDLIGILDVERWQRPDSVVHNGTSSDDCNRYFSLIGSMIEVSKEIRYHVGRCCSHRRGRRVVTQFRSETHKSRQVR